MATTGLLGVIDARPNNFVLDGGTPSTGSVFDRSMESAISLTSTAYQNLRKGVATSAISATVAATRLTNHLRSASSALSMAMTAAAGQKLSKSATSVLSLGSSASDQRTRFAASSALTLTDSAVVRAPFVRSVTSPIALSDTSHAGQTFIETASSALALTSTATRSGSIRVSATSPLTFLNLADHRIKVRFAESVLDMAVSASRDRVYVAESPITLTQLAEQGVRYLRATSALALVSNARSKAITFGPGGPPTYDHTLDGNQIVLTQTVRSSIKMLSASSPITFAENVLCVHPHRVSATNELTSTEEVYNPDTISFDTVDTGLRVDTNFRTNRAQHANTIISFAQPATVSHLRSDATAESASSAMSLTSTAILSKTGSATSTIAAAQTASSILSNAQIDNSLELGDLASVTIRRGVVNESQVVPLYQSVAFSLVKDDSICNYSPFIGSTSDPNAPTPPPEDLPTLAGLPAGVQFRLEYPATGPVTDTLDMRAPDLGNRDRLSFNRVNRETRGGTLIVFADSIWPKVQTLGLNFSGLKREVAQDLLTFIQSHLGEEIKLTDWEGRVWTGVIMNPNDPVTEDSKNRFSASFEFEGAPA